jgi:hypothetical protein
MIIWLALLIPVGIAIFLYKRYQHETLWWEFVIPFIASILLIVISKALIEHAQTRDTEYWGGTLQRAEYYEAWDEEVPCIHRNPCTCNNKNGSCTSFHGYQHAYDVDDHPPHWEIYDSNGIEVSVSRDRFEMLARRFGNRVFHDMHRDYHSVDGDMYRATWGGDQLTLIPVTTAHSYENRVAVSDSVFNYPEVNPKDFGLYEYPPIQNFYECNSILGVGDQTQGVALTKLNRFNATMGAKKQVRMLIVIFKNQPLQAGFDQESYWKGGNKNEFIVTIGVNNEFNVEWCHVFSWTEVESLKVNVREFVASQDKLNLEKVVDYMVPQVEEHFIRKPFADFDYLTIEPPGWAIFLVFLFVGGINGGLSYWIIANEHREGGRRFGGYRFRRPRHWS